jgi:uncharacterized iron-regulated membrane protein
MTFKKIVNKLHLWLGFTSGLVVFVVSITGCMYAFKDEIEEASQSYRRVEFQERAFLPPSKLKAVAEGELPGKKIHGVQYGAKDRATVVSFWSPDPEYYYLVYINPYSGKVLKVKDLNKDFFRFVLDGHFYLWLPENIGQPLVATSTLIFLIMLLSGLILWWPKNKSAVKQRFTIKWSAKWRRKNYDMHNVLGFYMTWIVLFIALTGLVWGFQWFAKGSYWLISGGNQMLEYSEPISDTTSILSKADLSPSDKIWYKMNSELKRYSSIEVHFPETNKSPVLVELNPKFGTYYKIDYRFFDQYTLKELEVNHRWGKYNKADIPDKIFRMNYDIHVGAILGLPGKILAFFASLIAASLPVTGFYIWWGRRNKERKSKIKCLKGNHSQRRLERQSKLLGSVN